MYKTKSGKTINPGSEIAKGGEGVVYNIQNDDENCIKIYRNSKIIEGKEEKIKYMIENPPIEIQGINFKICWPKDLIFKNEEFVGFLMPKSFEDSLLPYHLCQPEIPKSFQNQWDSTYNRKTQKGLISRLKLCVNITAAINRIHKVKKYVIVDLKPQNLLVTQSGKISIIDLDSVQIAEKGKILFNAPVSTPEYTPPEANAILEKNKIITKDWDTFSLGILVYEILFGIHPYVGTAAPPNDNFNTLQEKIKVDLTHVIKGESSFTILPPPHKLFYSFPSDFKNIFKKIFSPYDIVKGTRPTLESFGGILFKTIKVFEEQKNKSKEKTIKLEEQEAINNYPKLKLEYSQLQIQDIQIRTQIENLKKENIILKKNKEANKEKASGDRNLVAAILGILLLLLGISYVNLYSSANDQTSEVKKLRKENNELIKYSNPITIQDIKFSSSDYDGEKYYFRGLSTNLPRRQIYFLVPNVTYYAHKNSNLDIDVRIYGPSGVKKGDESKNGYTYSKEIYFKKGYNNIRFMGWGNDRVNIYRSGSHSIQIWHEGKILFQKKFRVK